MYSRGALRIARDIEEAGFERRQAEAGGQADEQAAVKPDGAAVGSDIAMLRYAMRWMFCINSVLLAVTARVYDIV